MSETGTPQAWKLESSERLAEYSVFAVRRDRVRSPRNGNSYDFDVVEASDGVTVLAFTEAGEMVLVEQFRHGVRRSSLETPSGFLDEGEEPVAAGLRELREETGFETDSAELLGTLTLNPSWQTTRVHVVLARGARRSAERDLDESEDTRVRCAPPERVRELVRDGEIDSAVVVAALALLTFQDAPAS